jgi:adenylosuccinate lyase
VKPIITNVLASRYASAEMAGLWTAEYRIVLERRLWLAVLRAQKELGVDVPDGVIEAYEAVVDTVALDSIATRERVTRHDVKARIEEFSALAGHEHVHKAMTSRDLTENVEQLQIRDSLVLVRCRMLAANRDGGAEPQRAGPGHHARQAVRQRRPGAPDRAATHR